MNLSSYVEKRNLNAIQKESQVSQDDLPKDADFYSYVLYVNNQENRDQLSSMALDILSKKLNMKKMTMIVFVQTLTTKPDYVDTVPMLVTKEKKAYKGEKLLEFLTVTKDLPFSNNYRNHQKRKVNAWTL